jgi:hypothetical protein
MNGLDDDSGKWRYHTGLPSKRVAEADRCCQLFDLFR